MCDLRYFNIPRVDTTDAIDWRLALWDRTWRKIRSKNTRQWCLPKNGCGRPTNGRSHFALNGDFRNGNFLYDEESGEITGLLDWELCSLGTDIVILATQCFVRGDIVDQTVNS